jgi:hypothetical protein
MLPVVPNREETLDEPGRQDNVLGSVDDAAETCRAAIRFDRHTRHRRVRRRVEFPGSTMSRIIVSAISRAIWWKKISSAVLIECAKRRPRSTLSLRRASKWSSEAGVDLYTS